MLFKEKNFFDDVKKALLCFYEVVPLSKSFSLFYSPILIFLEKIQALSSAAAHKFQFQHLIVHFPQVIFSQPFFCLFKRFGLSIFYRNLLFQFSDR
jgi:hypothetical protein